MELEQALPRVRSLQQTAEHLLVSTPVMDDDEAASKSQLISIGRRLDKLLKVCQTYLTDIERVVGVQTDYASGVSII